MTPNRLVIYKILIGIGLLLAIFMAWTSEGFYHYDEHYQIIEFAQYKSGKAVPEGLAWEFHEKIRPGLQPFLAYLVLQASYGMGLDNPFFIAFILRLISLVISLWVAYHFGKWISKECKLQHASIVFGLLVLFFWCSSFLMVRFSSENFGGLAFIGGVILLSDAKRWNFLLAGLLFGIAFQFRYQMAFAILGYLAWYLFKRQFSFKTWTMIFVGSFISIGIGVLLDYWLYASWQLTAIKYFTSNIIDDKASAFGVSPWYFYFKSLFLSLGPVLNVLAISLCVYGIYRMRNHPIIWSLIVFLIGHILVPHKELRFLFPMWFFFLGLISIAIIHIYNYHHAKPVIFISILVIALLLNSTLLFYRISTPAHKYMPYFKYVYSKAKETKDVQMYFDGFNMYGPYGLRITFYRPYNLIQLPLDEPDIASKPLAANSLFFQRGTLDDKYKRVIKSRAFSCKTWDMSAFQLKFSLPQKVFLNWNIYYVK